MVGPDDSIAPEIRAQAPGELATVVEVNQLAFGRPDEGELVRRLVEDCPDVISLVAVVEGAVVGHILFSPIVLQCDDASELPGMALAPMAVLPDWQMRGIGMQLVNAGLAATYRSQCPFVVVLGHPTYYPRFGFERASRYGVRCPWEAPDEAFMVIAADPDALHPGTIRYRSEFEALA